VIARLPVAKTCLPEDSLRALRALVIEMPTSRARARNKFDVGMTNLLSVVLMAREEGELYILSRVWIYGDGMYYLRGFTIFQIKIHAPLLTAPFSIHDDALTFPKSRKRFYSEIVLCNAPPFQI
jgi:hypothetical protein